MAEELQNLLEKINNDGIRKAEAEREKILAAAREDAAAIRAAAEKDAAEMRSAAEKDNSALHAKTVASLRQAHRDIMLQLKSDLQEKMQKIAGDSVAQALSPDFMAQIISELYTSFAAAPEQELSVRCAVKETAALDAALRSALADRLVKEIGVSGAGSITSGMEVSFDGGKCYFDFTDDAVCDLLNDYLGEKLAAIFKAEK